VAEPSWFIAGRKLRGINGMRKHKNLTPIIFIDEHGNKQIDTLVCVDCYKEITVSPMTLQQYLAIK
jgi:hypothetical protein